jgi:hypothetical protein
MFPHITVYCSLPCSQFQGECTRTFGDKCERMYVVGAPNATVATTCVRAGNPDWGQVNFDTIGGATLASFTFMTTEGWSDTMYVIWGTWGVPWLVSLLFAVFIYGSSLFILQLALAVIWNEYTRVAAQQKMQTMQVYQLLVSLQDAGMPGAPGTPTTPAASMAKLSNLSSTLVKINSLSSPQGMTAAQKIHRSRAVGRRIAGLNIEPKRVRNRHSTLYSCVRNTLNLSFAKKFIALVAHWSEIAPPVPAFLQKPTKKFVSSLWFERFIGVVVIANGLIVGAEHESMTSKTGDVLRVANVIPVVIFIVELTLRILAAGPRRFFQSKFNTADFFVIILSIVDAAIDMLMWKGGAPAKYAPLRVIRVLRLFRIARSWMSLRLMLRNIADAVPAAINAAILLSILAYAAGITGMQLFGGGYGPAIGRGDIEEVPRLNFNSLWLSFVTIFQLIDNENWDMTLNVHMGAFGPAAALFFVAVLIVGNYVFLNVFIALLIHHFEEASERYAAERKLDGPTIWQRVMKRVKDCCIRPEHIKSVIRRTVAAPIAILTKKPSAASMVRTASGNALVSDGSNGAAGLTKKLSAASMTRTQSGHNISADGSPAPPGLTKKPSAASMTRTQSGHNIAVDGSPAPPGLTKKPSAASMTGYNIGDGTMPKSALKRPNSSASMTPALPTPEALKAMEDLRIMAMKTGVVYSTVPTGRAISVAAYIPTHDNSHTGKVRLLNENNRRMRIEITRTGEVEVSTLELKETEAMFTQMSTESSRTLVKASVPLKDIIAKSIRGIMGRNAVKAGDAGTNTTGSSGSNSRLFGGKNKGGHPMMNANIWHTVQSGGAHNPRDHGASQRNLSSYLSATYNSASSRDLGIGLTESVEDDEDTACKCCRPCCRCLHSSILRFRKMCAAIVTSVAFERLIIFAILWSTANLALDHPSVSICSKSPTTDPHASCVQLARYLLSADYVITGLFLLEMVLQITARGLWGHKPSIPCRWLAVVRCIHCVSLCRCAGSWKHGSASPALITRSTIVAAAARDCQVPASEAGSKCVFEALPRLHDVAIVVFMISYMFAAIGVQNFRGFMYSCNDPTMITQQECTGTFNATGAMCMVLPTMEAELRATSPRWARHSHASGSPTSLTLTISSTPPWWCLSWPRERTGQLWQ